jgi:hypothetical protein
MKKIVFTIALGLGLLTANAQIQSLAGPRLGLVYLSTSPGSSFLNGDLQLDEMGDLPKNYNDIAKGALTSLYGWQWESRFADGGNVTGIVEWIALVGGMEKGKFLPSVSSMVGARTASGIEFAVGPNLSLSGISMVFGVGYNFRSGNLNIPVNFAFVPGRTIKQSGIHQSSDKGEDGEWGTADDVEGYNYDVVYHSGNRFSITVGFNLSK